MLFTGASLLVQLIPVAPPRMLPGAGLVDTAARYGESVYAWSGGLDADQFSAMPSVHVGWALIVAMAVITVSRSRWRWAAAAYPALTTLVVAVTANHFWMDGIAAAGLLIAALLAQRAARSVRGRLVLRSRLADPARLLLRPARAARQKLCAPEKYLPRRLTFRRDRNRAGLRCMAAPADHRVNKSCL